MPRVALFPWLICSMEPADDQRRKIASAGNEDFNTSRIYGQLSRGPLKGSQRSSQQRSIGEEEEAGARHKRTSGLG